jgi:hypothetical protein
MFGVGEGVKVGVFDNVGVEVIARVEVGVLVSVGVAVAISRRLSGVEVDWSASVEGTAVAVAGAHPIRMKIPVRNPSI